MTRPNLPMLTLIAVLFLSTFSFAQTALKPVALKVQQAKQAQNVATSVQLFDQSNDLQILSETQSALTKATILDLRTQDLKTAFEGNYGFKENDSLALKKLTDLGYELIPIELPKTPRLTFILQAEAAAAFDLLTRSGQDDLMVRQIKNAWPNVFRAARFMPAVEYIQANRLRTQLIEEMHKVMQKVDVYIHPSWASTSLGITNLTGHPCLVLPNGFRNGRPTSISITGQLFGEADILSLGKVLEGELNFYDSKPEGF